MFKVGPNAALRVTWVTFSNPLGIEKVMIRPLARTESKTLKIGPTAAMSDAMAKNCFLVLVKISSSNIRNKFLRSST